MKKLYLFAIWAAISVQAQTTFSGVSTHFEALGTPYGGCGVPPDLVETDYYVALNVYDSPGIGTMWPRPLKGQDTLYKGEFNNGRNCGRWVKVAIMEDCIGGTNDGALGQTFCRGSNAKWINDKYSYAYLNMIVTDACGDNNGWCRDSKYHLDLHTPSLNKFEKAGVAVADMYPTHFNNRKISWEYIKAPQYNGDVDIYFMQNAQYYWSSILINHLENGIHAVEQKVGDKWVRLTMNSDMGQAYILETAEPPYRIRIVDAEDRYVKGGREYLFSFPQTCGAKCSAPATKVDYQVFDPILTKDHESVESSATFGIFNSLEQCTLVWDGLSGASTIEILDLAARTIQVFNIESAQGQRTLSGLGKGMYHAVLKQQRKGVSHSERVVIY